MISVSIHEAKAQLSALVSRVETSGEPVAICRHGRAVVEIVPRSRKSRTTLSPRLSKIKIKYDPTEPTQGEWENV